MAVDFCDYFWGYNADGYKIMCQNMKSETIAVKKIIKFFKDLSKIQSIIGKGYKSLLTQLSSTGSCGTFSPMVLAFKVSAEKLALIHNQWTVKLNELAKEVSRYAEELHKKHKQVKDEEAPTLAAVKTVQDSYASLNKCKETYKQKCQELEKLKRDGSSPKEIEKAESKYRRAHEEYKSSVSTYGNAREDFERKMTLATKRFQDIETSHLSQLRTHVETYCQIVDYNNNQLGRVYQDFQIQLTDLTVENLLEQFTLAKHTGLEKPGILGIKRGRKKEKKGKKVSSGIKDDDTEHTTSKDMISICSDSEEVQKSVSPTPEVDEEGYSKPPPNASRIGIDDDPWADFNRHQSNFGSSSDDSDDESRKPKIKVEIKPISAIQKADVSNGSSSSFSASVDELRSAVVGLELAPSLGQRDAKPQLVMSKTSFEQNNSNLSTNSLMRSHSHSNVNKPSQDLLGLTLHEISDPIDTPKSSIAENSGSQENQNKDVNNPNEVDKDNSLNAQDSAASYNTSKEVQDILGGMNDFNQSTFSQQPLLPPKQRPNSAQQREKISKGLKPLPRPPSRQTSILRHETSQRISPIPAMNNSSSSLLENTRRLNTNSRKPSVASSIASEDSVELNNDSHKMSSNGQLLSSIGSKLTPSPLLPSKPATNRTTDPTATTIGNRINTLNSSQSFGPSRGPSPLTLGLNDVVPLAVAFQEVCHACFRGSDESQVQVRLIGDLMISFPAGIVNVIANNINPAPLQFDLSNSKALESLLPNKELIHPISKSTNDDPDSKMFEFNMKSLQELLKQQSEQNPSASYFNVDILKYQVRAKHGAGSCPLQMVAYWKCEGTHTDLRLDYKYNAHTMATPCPLLNLTVAVPIDGGVKNMQSQPTGTWIKETSRAIWKFPELSQHNNGGVGSLRARFQLTNGPGSQGTIAAQFNCEGTTLSGVDFQLIGPGYRLSLAKKRFVSGKYICDGNASSSGGDQYRYAAPPIRDKDAGSGSEC